MIESSGPCRQKYWHEMDEKERLAKLADSLEYLCKQYLELTQLVQRLQFHRHGEFGLPVIAIDHKDSHEPWILRNPLNRADR